MSPQEYEKYAAGFLARLGHTNIKVTGKPSDHGVDVISLSPEQEYAITQVKFYEDPVGEKVIRDLAGSMALHNVTRAILVTNSFLTKPAIIAAAQLGIDCYQNVQPIKQKSTIRIEDVERIAKDYCKQRGIKVRKILEVEQVFNAVAQYSVVVAAKHRAHWFSGAKEFELKLTIDMLSNSVIGYQQD